MEGGRNRGIESDRKYSYIHVGSCTKGTTGHCRKELQYIVYMYMYAHVLQYMYIYM